MQKRTAKVALLAVLAIALVVGLSAVAFAGPSWRDLPDSVTAKYGITDNQVAAISEGYASGVWKPFQGVTRAQFTKMAVAAFKIPLARPAIPSYTDVTSSNQFFPYIEAAKASGIVAGTTATTFSPNVLITRQQAIAIVSRYIAKVQGFNLATMYTAADIETLLAHFGDASAISTDLRDEIAFAFDMGITTGDDYGNVNPLATLMRIQGAAFLIRAQGLVPPKLFHPANLELVSADKTEGLIGQVYPATFRVTTADGHPASGVLVDFDAITANDFYVGQVSPEAMVTNNNGEVTVNLTSAEPGTMRVSASVQGVGTVYLTRYWLAIDEVYTTGETTARNNAGVEHTWEVRVVVFGPGPRSTSANDWYNAIDASFDPADIDVEDGVDYTCDYEGFDGWTIATEEAMKADGFTPRTMAGIDVEWSIYDLANDPDTPTGPDPVISVGDIVKVNGASIVPAKNAVGKTDANGLSSITIVSKAIGRTFTKAVADYPGNPYPEQLFDHSTFNDFESHALDWEDQPSDAAKQVKTWIAHVIGGDPGPIDPSYQTACIGEEITLTLTLLDSYGNTVPGRSVEWTMQGVGFFQTDDAGDSSDIYVAANNKDFDTTDAEGKATLFVKSYEAGEQIIHAKVRDKGTGGAGGAYAAYTAEVQWFDADVVTFDDPTTTGTYVADPATGLLTKWDEQNEALATNPVSTSHEFCVHVYGLKLEYDPVLDDMDRQTPYIDSDAAANSYDGIFDAKDAAYFGGILLVNPENLLGSGAVLDQGDGGKIVANTDPSTVQVGGRTIKLSYVGGYTKFDFDDDGYKEDFQGVTGIYLPLEGREVRFSVANSKGVDLSNTGAFFDGEIVPAVGTVTPAAPTSVTTDAEGKACVTVASDLKGPQTIRAVVDWPGNPHNGAAMARAYAKKLWVAGNVASPDDVTIQIYINDTLIATNKEGVLKDSNGDPLAGHTPAYAEGSTADRKILNNARVAVHVLDAYGNDLPDYEVVYLLEGINSWLRGTQHAADTFIPWAYLAALYDDVDETGITNYDRNSNRPDSDEPVPDNDPYGRIVGPGGTWSFFFNQWLGSEKPEYAGHAGLESWWKRVSGLGFLGYHADYPMTANQYQFPSNYPGAVVPFDGFDGVIDGVYSEPWNYPDWPSSPNYHVGLATDGAKAWTLNGFYDAGGELGIQPNLLTGSRVDIQLADALREGAEGIHLKSILRVMVYSPADGLVKEELPIWSVQVHNVWEIPVPTTIELEPSIDWPVAGLEETQLTLTVLDQFGDPMPDVPVYLNSTVLEGTIAPEWNDELVGVTDENGNLAITHSGQDSGEWGVEQVRARVDNGSPTGLVSDPTIIQWVYDDTGSSLVDTLASQSVVKVNPGILSWSGKVIRVYTNPALSLQNEFVGSRTYVASSGAAISTSVDWESGKRIYLNANSVDTDEVPNWIVDQVP